MKTHPLVPLALALATTVLAGCSREVGTQSDVTPATPPHPPGSTEVHAIARLQPTEGSKVRGIVRFTSANGAVRVAADVIGLEPGAHGFHIHESGDCSAPDASSAGGHFNPTNQPHGPREGEARHIGDLGNIVADEQGRAHFDYYDNKLALTGPNSILGRAVVVHAGRDDLQSQPSGESGQRVACATIELERQNF